MGMSIDDSIELFEDNFTVIDTHGHYTEEEETQATAIAIDTMRKYQQLQADYENRLKADMVAMLEELKAEIEELYPKARKTYRDGLTSYCEGVDDSREIIQQKIDKLKENIEEAVLHIITERDTGGQNGR